MSTFKITIEGLKEFSREAKAVDKAFGKELRQAHLKIAKLVESRTHSKMKGGGRQASKATKGVKAKATQKMAAIITTPGPDGFTLAVIWGQKRRSGWFGYRRYLGSGAHQAQPWVGNQYEPGEAAGKPYYLGDAANESIDEAIDIFADAVTVIARKAGFT